MLCEHGLWSATTSHMDHIETTSTSSVTIRKWSGPRHIKLGAVWQSALAVVRETSRSLIMFATIVQCELLS